MHYNAASTLFNKADVNRESEFSQRSSNAFGERIASSSTNRIIDDFPRVTNGDANAVFDQMHLNRNNFNERNRVGSGENTFNGASSITDNARRYYSPDSGEHTFGGASSITDNTRRYYSPDSGKHTFGGASSITDNARRYYSPDSGEHTFGGASSITDNARRYYSPDSGDLFIDPNPEIITRPDPRQPPTYTQKVTIRYLQPPPLPPSNVNSFFVTLYFCFLNQKVILFSKIIKKFIHLHHHLRPYHRNRVLLKHSEMLPIVLVRSNFFFFFYNTLNIWNVFFR